MRDLANTFGEPKQSVEYADLANQTAHRFADAFWNPDLQCLYDCLGDLGPDPAIRPNQIFALSLPHRMLDADRDGDPHSRDGAYHQGTVWGWLIGPFISAWVRIHRNDPDVHATARRMLLPLSSHFQEGGQGHISEIFDGDAPHASRGCFAQAWSTAEVLRAFCEDVLDYKPDVASIS
jgi:glycogen debranching enzyme